MAAPAATTNATDWVYLYDEDSRTHYYADLTTGQTSWERPTVLDEPAPSAAPQRTRRRGSTKANAAKWVEFFDEEQGLPYYYNEANGESVWVLPADDDDDDDDEDDPVTGNDEEAVRLEKMARHRDKVIEEIIATEKTYVEALQCCLKVYLHPLRMVADVPRGAIFSHDDLDAIFLNIEVIAKVNEKFLTELQYSTPAEALKAAARQFKGCYTRYVNNYDAAEAKLRKIRQSQEASDREKQRYLTGATSHPDAKGRDVTAFLIQPVQRVLRYRLLLEELLKHTEAGDRDEAAIREARDRVCELAMSFNEDKRQTDEFAKLRNVFTKFVDADATTLRNELLSYERKLLLEGSLVKVRLSHRQRRTLFLFNDVLIYAASTMKGCGMPTHAARAPRRLRPTSRPLRARSFRFSPPR